MIPYSSYIRSSEVVFLYIYICGKYQWFNVKQLSSPKWHSSRICIGTYTISYIYQLRCSSWLLQPMSVWLMLLAVSRVLISLHSRDIFWHHCLFKAGWCWLVTFPHKGSKNTYRHTYIFSNACASNRLRQYTASSKYFYNGSKPLWDGRL